MAIQTLSFALLCGFLFIHNISSLQVSKKVCFSSIKQVSISFAHWSNMSTPPSGTPSPPKAQAASPSSKKGYKALYAKPKAADGIPQLASCVFHCGARAITDYQDNLEKLSKHVGSTFDLGGELCSSILTGKVDAGTRPRDPATNADAIAKEIWKIEITEYIKTKNKLTAQLKKVYALIWGQCSDYMRARVKTMPDYATFSSDQEPLALLKAVKKRPITACNPQANAIIERVHQTIGQMLRTQQLQNTDLIDNPFQGVLAAVSFAIRATVHTTLQATPSQLVFGRDHIMNVKHTANWKNILDQKQKIINKNNHLENKKRKRYEYVVGQKVLVKQEQSRKFGKNPYEGPYEIITLQNNGTAKLKLLHLRGATYQTYNIRNMFPYSE